MECELYSTKFAEVKTEIHNPFTNKVEQIKKHIPFSADEELRIREYLDSPQCKKTDEDESEISDEGKYGGYIVYHQEYSPLISISSDCYESPIPEFIRIVSVNPPNDLFCEFVYDLAMVGKFMIGLSNLKKKLAVSSITETEFPPSWGIIEACESSNQLKDLMTSEFVAGKQQLERLKRQWGSGSND